MPFSNIVGYQQITVPQGWSLFTPTFKGVTNSTFKLGDIVLCNASGVEFDDNTSGAGRSRSKIVVRVMDNGSGELDASACNYTSAGYAKRYGDASGTWGWGANKNVSIAAGSGIIVNNTQGSDVKFQISGEVELTPVYNLPTGWGVFGNNTPNDITLADIMVCNASGVEFDDNTSGAGRSRSKIVARKMDASTGELASASYNYTSAGYAKRYGDAADTWGWGANKSVPIKAGEALIVNNTQGTVVRFRLKSPIE